MSSSSNVDPMKKSSIYATFGRYYGEKLYKLLFDCCSGLPGSFCYEVLKCLGISPQGDNSKFLNQQGEWVEAGISCEGVNTCLGISEEGDEALVLNQKGEWITNGSGSDQNLQQVTDVGNTTDNDIQFDSGVGILLDNGSRLREGTIDAGLGGSKGIAQICAVGYELKWEAGRLYVMDGNGIYIRWSLYNFTLTPTVTDDSTLGYLPGSRWTLDDGSVYLCTDSSTGAAVWVLQSSSGYIYEIGQYVAAQGGVIAHRWLSTSSLGSPTSGTIQNYLVVDTADLSASAQFATLNVDISNVESTWDGFTNTANLIAAGAGSGITAGTAAVLCDSSTNNGKSDWYLPAIDELSKIWQNRWDIAQGIATASGTQLAFASYWSSTEYGAAGAYLFAFGFGYAFNDLKTGTYSVRGVRKFSI